MNDVTKLKNDFEAAVEKQRQLSGRNDIPRAYTFAEAAHEGQFRNTGEPYLCHVVRVATRLVTIGADRITIIAALLHDAPDYTKKTLRDIERTFGGEISRLVSGVAQLSKVRLGENRKEEKLENLRRMFLAMARDLRVVLIKLASRLDNMETIEGLPHDLRPIYAKETLEIYAPIASRLGIGQWKGRLEDLAFPYVYPSEYREVKELVGKKIGERKDFVEKVKRTLLKELAGAGVRVATSDSRVKHLYSLWRKLLRYESNLGKIHDLVALRIIVPEVEDCYRALGIIHKLWRPVPGSFDDYIANPKPNGYRSLHTDVFALGNEIIEIQIRTPEMHQEAEFGIAAHWYYETVKEDPKKQKAVIMPKQKLIWMKELTRALKEGDWASLKLDFFKDRIFVFTPKGDAIDLPVGGTPVDFAYQIHSDLGNQCAGAKVNGKLVPLDYQLKTGEVVEILTQKNKKPSEDWLSFVKTRLARGHIRQALRARSPRKSS